MGAVREGRKPAECAVREGRRGR